MSQRVAELEQERDDLRADLHDTESRLRDALTLARNYGMQAEEQGRWWREAKEKLQAAEQRIQELQRDTARHLNQQLLWIDATPDAEYPIRILRAYKQQCEGRAAIDTQGAEDWVCKVMNEASEEREKILDAAIRALLAPASPDVRPSPTSQRT